MKESWESAAAIRRRDDVEHDLRHGARCIQRVPVGIDGFARGGHRCNSDGRCRASDCTVAVMAADQSCHSKTGHCESDRQALSTVPSSRGCSYPTERQCKSCETSQQQKGRESSTV